MSSSLIIGYHSIDRSGSPISVRPDQFFGQMQILKVSGYRFVTVSELVASGERHGLVAVTFDDGFRSVIECAGPILEEFGPATVFPILDGFGRSINWTEQGKRLPPLPMMELDDIALLSARGWEIGAHGSSHRCLLGRSAGDLGEELNRSLGLLRAINPGASGYGFAYPQGCFDRALAATVSAAGYDWACTTVPWMLPGISSASRMTLPRLVVGHNFSARRFRVALRLLPRAIKSVLPGDSNLVNRGHRHHADRDSHSFV